MTEKISWNTHCILTRVALLSCVEPVLDSEVPVTEIGHFVEAAGRELPDLLRRCYESAMGNAPERGGEGFTLVRIATPDDLVRALRLNPAIPLSYVRALKPEEVPAEAAHDPFRSGPPASSYAPTRNMEPMQVREVLATFSDEPDWGMDQDLFPIKSYGYGATPFGPETGGSSQAPFHMAFLRENAVSLKIWPGLGISFMEQRIRLFLALARLALDKRVDYWGWRFAGWAAHYLQDLTQPYHARALPFPIRTILRLLVSSPYPHLERRRNYLANRHWLFEAAIHYLLNDAVKNGSAHPLLKSLEGSGEYYTGPPERVMEESSTRPAEIAIAANRLLERIIDDPRINRHDYSVSEVTDYPVASKLVAASVEHPEIFQRFLEISSRCLAETGKVTRYVVKTIAASGLTWEECPARNF